MTIEQSIKKEFQTIAKCKQSISLEQVKKRKQETRRKIELGGLVIKSGLDTYEKNIILGGLMYLFELLKDDNLFQSTLRSKGNYYLSY
jgi:hypothetical protein